MKKKIWLTHPGLSVLLGVSWLLLQHTLAPVHLISAVLIGVVIPRLLHTVLPPAANLQWRPTLLLARRVLWDIVVSNFTVARLVLGPLSRMQSAWVTLPVALTHPTAISLLATIITTTPGTVSCIVDEERRQILIHALNCNDPDQMIAEIRARYEAPLLVIFEHHPHDTGAST